jgi:transcription elongation factor Elf1
MSDYWKCPKCGAILKKGLAGVISRYASVSGTATCGECGAKFSQQDVYDGKYDVSRDD